MSPFHTIQLLALGSLLASGPQTVVIDATRDNTLFEDGAGALSNGSGQHFFVGRNDVFGGATTRRGLVHFDVAASVPTGATITNVTLDLECTIARPFGDPNPIRLHRVLADWGEGASDSGLMLGMGAPAQANDATWLHTFFPGSFWVTPGGDFAPLASATTVVTAIGPYSWSSGPMVADVQSWLDAASSNHGWLVRADETLVGDAKSFASRENPTAQRPRLTIEFLPAASVPALPPAALCLLVLVLAGLGGARLRAGRSRPRPVPGR